MRRFGIPALLLSLVAGVSGVAAAPAATAATAATAQGCTPWGTVSQIYATSLPYGRGAVDRSVRFGLQFQRCTFGTSVVKHYRLAVTNVRASGKTDIAVGLKAGFESPLGGLGGACYPVVHRTFGVWHPRVAAGTTWTSPAAAATGRDGVRIWGDIRVSYPGASYIGVTDQCRQI
jgi:hypothetical protein